MERVIFTAKLGMYTDMDGCGAVWRCIIQVSDAKHVERYGADTLKDHRHDKSSQVLAAVSQLITRTPVPGVAIQQTPWLNYPIVTPRRRQKYRYRLYGRRQRGAAVCRGSDTQTIYVGDINMYISPTKT